jgi:hypothetical protein
MDHNIFWDEVTASWLLKRAKPAGMVCVLDEDIWFLVKRDIMKKGKYKREEAIDIEKKKNIADIVEKLVAFDYLKFDGKCERIDCRMKRYVLTTKGIEFQSWEQERKNPTRRYKLLGNKRNRVEEKLEITQKKNWNLERAEIWQKLVFAVLVILGIYGIMKVLMLFF